ncbi:MAG: hypothetical protein ACEQSB_03050 [Undibacterium sp.]
MFHLNPSTAYFWFALWTALVWYLAYVFLPQSRSAQLWMSQWGLVGGPVINLVYQTDFWQPVGIIPFLPIESAVFGAGFLGAMTAIRHLLSGGSYYLERVPSVRRSTKVWTLVTAVLVSFVVYLAGLNSVTATAVGLIAGSGMMLMARHDLWRDFAKGVAASILSYLAIVGLFVLLVAGNTDVLGRELSMFYATRGAVGTATLLTLWAIAFGAFFGPFHPWAKNLRQIEL